MEYEGKDDDWEKTYRKTRGKWIKELANWQKEWKGKWKEWKGAHKNTLKKWRVLRKRHCEPATQKSKPEDSALVNEGKKRKREDDDDPQVHPSKKLKQDDSIEIESILDL